MNYVKNVVRLIKRKNISFLFRSPNFSYCIFQLDELPRKSVSSFIRIYLYIRLSPPRFDHRNSGTFYCKINVNLFSKFKFIFLAIIPSSQLANGIRRLDEHYRKMKSAEDFLVRYSSLLFR